MLPFDNNTVQATHSWFTTNGEGPKFRKIGDKIKIEWEKQDLNVDAEATLKDSNTITVSVQNTIFEYKLTSKSQTKKQIKFEGKQICGKTLQTLDLLDEVQWSQSPYYCYRQNTKYSNYTRCEYEKGKFLCIRADWCPITSVKLVDKWMSELAQIKSFKETGW